LAAFLNTVIKILVFGTRREISWSAERLSASQGFFSMKSVQTKIKWTLSIHTQ